LQEYQQRKKWNEGKKKSVEQSGIQNRGTVVGAKGGLFSRFGKREIARVGKGKDEKKRNEKSSGQC